MVKVIFSPAKKQQYGTWQNDLPMQLPIFQEEISVLNSYLQTKSISELAEMMDISRALAELNYSRISNFKDQWSTDHTGPAILSFKGDAYRSLDAESLNNKDLIWANDHIYIISGLYGLLRPMDQLQYYRLEMKTKLTGFSHKNLYEFWGNKLSNYIGTEQVINLASSEYSKAINIPNITRIDFKDKYQSGYKTIGVKAKRARGLMLRWIIQNRVTNTEQLKAFDNGYYYNKNMSTSNNWVYTN